MLFTVVCKIISHPSLENYLCQVCVATLFELSLALVHLEFLEFSPKILVKNPKSLVCVSKSLFLRLKIFSCHLQKIDYPNKTSLSEMLDIINKTDTVFFTCSFRKVI